MPRNGNRRDFLKTMASGAAFLPLGAKSIAAACDRTVGLMDLYPTLIDLCGLPKRDDIAGRSIAPLLANPDSPWDYPTLTTYQQGNHTVRSERWRYTRYADGGEELYDHDRDPMEWDNLADKPEHAGVKKTLAAWMPTRDAQDAPRNEDMGLVKENKTKSTEEKRAERKSRRENSRP